MFKVAGDPFFILITTLDISFFLTLSLSAVVLSIFFVCVYGSVYGVCVYSVKPLVLKLSVTRHCSTLSCKNVPNYAETQHGQSDMAFLIDRELSCCQLDAGLLSISG